MLRKVLVGMDGSEPARRAAEMAMQIAYHCDANVELVAVVPPVVLATDVPQMDVALLEANRNASEAMLREVIQQLQRPNMPLVGRVIVGPPAESISDLAHAEDVDMVVVGSRGRGAVARVLLGSVADRLSHICKKPLLIVR